MVKNNKFDFEVINNGKKINPDNFYGLTKYLTKEERRLIEKALDSEKIDKSFIEKSDGDTDTKKQKGYTLFVLIYCKSICLELQERAQEVQYTLSIRETRETQYIDTIDVTLKQIDAVLAIIDTILQSFQLSSPGDESFPKDEMTLLDIFSTQNKECPKYNNREFKDSPSFVKVLKPTSPNPADIYYMPDENFDIHNIQVNIQKAVSGKTDKNESFKHLGIRSFKKNLLKIVDSCFHIPTKARKDNNYICETLYPTKQINFKSAITDLLVLEILTNIPYPLCRFKLYMEMFPEPNSSDIISKFLEDHSDENNYNTEQFTAFERKKLENSRAYKFALFLKTNKIIDSVSEELLKRFNNSAQDYKAYVQEVYNKEIEEYLTDLHSKYTDVSDKDKLEEELQYKITST